MAPNTPQQITQLPFANYAQQQQQYTPDLQSSILNMFGQYGVDVSRYGGGVYADPQARLERIANELRSGQRTFTDVENSLRLAQSELSPEQVRANQMVAHEFNPQYQQLNRTLDTLQQNQSRDSDMAQRFAEWGRTAIGDTYENLGNQLTQNRDAVQASFQGAQSNLGSMYDQGDQILAAAREAALADTSGEAQALGVQGAVIDPHAQLRSAVSDLLGFNQQGRMNAQGTLQNLMTTHSGINSQAISDAGMESALMQDRHQLSAADMLSQIMGQYGQQRGDVLGQLSDLEASRGGRTAELLAQFQDQTYDRNRQRTLDDLAAEIQRGSLALQQQELGFNREQFGQEMSLNWAQFGLDRDVRMASLQNELAQTQDPLRRRQLELEIGLLEQELARGSQANQQYGQIGVDQYLRGLNMTGMPQIGNIWRDLLNQANAQGAAGADPYTVYENLVGSGPYANNAGVSSALRRLGEIYWGVGAQ